MRAMLRSIAVAGFFATGLLPAAAVPASEAAAVREVTQEYRNAWLANDPARVMATLTPDAILLPSGMAPINGAAAIRQFWWPHDGPMTTVTAMDLIIDELDVSGDLAYVRGRGTLTFRTGGITAPTRTLRSTYVNILRRQANYRWLISRRMWSDLR